MATRTTPTTPTTPATRTNAATALPAAAMTTTAAGPGPAAAATAAAAAAGAFVALAIAGTDAGNAAAQAAAPALLSPFDLNALPPELLESVLAWLPVADLVALRAVCRRWRAAIARIAAADAPYAYTCGLQDLLRNALWMQQERAREMETSMYGKLMQMRPVKGDEIMLPTLSDFLGRVVVNDALPCTCGGPRVLDGERTLGMEPHDARLRPARWALLAPERDLAFRVAEVAMALFRHYDLLRLSYYSHGGGCTHEWLPVWFYLPTDVQRPASAIELVHLAHELFIEYVQAGEQPLLAKLVDPVFARDFYAEAATVHQPDATESEAFDWENPSAWMDPAYPADAAHGPDVRPKGDDDSDDDGDDEGGDEDDEGEDEDDEDGDRFSTHQEHFEDAQNAVDEECPLFEKASTRTRATDPTWLETLRLDARQSAAAWRICRALNWMPWLNSEAIGTGFDSFQGRLQDNGVDVEDDDAVQTYLDSQVGATDRTVAEIRRMLQHAVVSGSGFGGGPLWVFGLSPGGHLVGAVTRVNDTD